MNLHGLKKIIVVQGQGSSGKSAILHAVCGQLVQVHGKASVRYHEQFVTKTGTDQHLVIDAKSKKRVCVCTPGDDANWIVKSFLLAERYRCDVLVLSVSVPVRSSTKAIARTAFDEIVAANSLKSLSPHLTTKVRPKKPRGYVDKAIVAAVMMQI